MHQYSIIVYDNHPDQVLRGILLVTMSFHKRKNENNFYNEYISMKNHDRQ